jgi:aminopeptidase-like protein
MLDLNALFDQLFPICRSITGAGIRQSMHMLQQVMPLQIHAVPSGRKVFDWEVPPEWQLHRATLTAPDGTVILDTDSSNLHVLNFSTPFIGELSLEELQPHLYSIPELPTAIPYVTSYYQRRWGLCLSHEQRQALTPGRYNVQIDTEIRAGVLNYATAFLPGDSGETILITSYLCHPSLANNELSGPLALAQLYHLLAELPQRRYSYQFLLIPETIGSITYLATEGKDLAPNLVAGMVLTCLGGPNQTLSLKMSRRDWIGQPSAIDRFARQLAMLDAEHFSVRDFTPCSGSDERQFCSPHINWPMLQAARTVYGDYAGYHNSLDDKAFMSIAQVEQSAQRLCQFWQLFELQDCYVRCTVDGGEPQLGKRGLYPTTNGPMTNQLSRDGRKDGRYVLNLLLQLLSLADGQFTLAAIAQKLAAPLLDLLPIVLELKREGLIELSVESPRS